ncbi:hypothetical protein TFKS16_0817 [Tannerella forsythia KS16]|uniref:hypothetical protein n=1 Tax=Tannerella forsythia TaxID=28112 RepID=UPI000618C457|nr:hypothetical protein [Tannerella forsythia]BAR48833.1 hypothetical protein TF3313_1306 [Tannerella forsythia 3313]BAR51110.1 hypothetical protein TFKS16_0817 [Tannerella forsythia KS16]
MEERKPIELRSEKVRNIIGQIPPVLLRYGTVIIGVTLAALCMLSMYIPYRETVPVHIVIEQSNDMVYGLALVPKDRILLMQTGNRVMIHDPLSGSPEATVSHISTVPARSDGRRREVRIAFPPTVTMQPGDVLEGRIILSDMSVFNRFLQSLRGR